MAARAVAASLVGLLIATERVGIDSGLHWVVLGLSFVIVTLVAAAAVRAARAGQAAAAQRVILGVVVWLALVGSAHLLDDHEGDTFQAPLLIVTNLLVLAWSDLLGRVVVQVGAPDARMLRAMGMMWLGLHSALQLVPLAGLASIGVAVISLVSIAAAVVPFGAVVVDGYRISRAMAGDAPLLDAQAQAGASPTDDPWRPGA